MIILDVIVLVSIQLVQNFTSAKWDKWARVPSCPDFELEITLFKISFSKSRPGTLSALCDLK